MTTYSEVTAADRDVAIFLAHHLQFINIWRLPLKAWVAREGETIVAVMTFDHITYPAIHVIVADPTTRPFMRIVKLWLMAYRYFKSIELPIVCAPVFNDLHHFQSLVRRLGFTKVGVETNSKGEETETIYAYDFTKEHA